MAEIWTKQRVLSLSPDAASASAGLGLAKAAKWPTLGREAGDAALWGEAQGSGKNPYQVRVDLRGAGGPAFKCSCPSRKFPCKHALGLLLIWAEDAAQLAEGPPPEWVATWLAARRDKAEAKATPAAEAPADPEAKRIKAKQVRAQKRDDKVAAGCAELSRFLQDLLRGGLAAAGTRPPGRWQEAAARLVDAQAPGLARLVRLLGDVVNVGDGWHGRFLARAGRLHLACEAFARVETLPPDLAEEVRGVIGFTAGADDLAFRPAEGGTWCVLGQVVEEEDRLTVQRTWLARADDGRPALVLSYAVANQPLDQSLLVGTQFDGELVFYPGRPPLRAAVRTRGEAAAMQAVPGVSMAAALDAYAGALADSPWVERWPVVVRDVTVGPDWSVRDAAGGGAFELAGSFAAGWELVSLGGGRPVTLAGEYDGQALRPLGVWVDGYLAFDTARDRASVGWVPRSSATPGTTGAPAAWRELTNAAILGVDRAGVPAGASPLKTGGEPAAVLLAAAAAVSTMVAAGRIWEPPGAPVAPDESADAPCGRRATTLLAAILYGNASSETANALLVEWATLANAAGVAAPPTTVPKLTNLAAAAKLGDGAAEVLRACGGRGRWLASLNPRWRSLHADRATPAAESGGAEAADAAAASFETASDAQRRVEALSRLRASDAPRATALLAAAWPSESAETKVALLGAMDPPRAEDEAFLESALDERATTVRKAAAALLSQLPASALAARMSARLAAAVTKKKRLLSKPELVVELSEDLDAEAKRDGLEARKRGGLGAKADLLRQLAALAPPAWWASLGDPADLLRAAAGGDWADALLAGWTEAATRRRDGAWAAALLRHALSQPPRQQFGVATRDGLEELTALAESLSPAARRALLAAALSSGVDALADPLVARLLLSGGEPFDESLSRTVLDALRRRAVTESLYLGPHVRELSARLGLRFAPALADEAGRGWPTASPHQTANEQFLAVFQPVLRLRADLRRAFQPDPNPEGAAA